MTRKPKFAGSFYPADSKELKNTLKKLFEGVKYSGTKPFGCIAPHAGYVFSGRGAARVYKEVQESKADVFVILGVNHRSRGTVVSGEDWETPLGIVKSNKEIVSKLVELGVERDDDAHAEEHSIEVQLPFLQTVQKDFTIVALMVADSDFETLGAKLQLAVGNANVCYICSSDFTHYGVNYGYLPFEENFRKEVEKLDKGAINLVLKCDSSRFLSYVEKTGATICGSHGIALLCWLCEQQNKSGRLLGYYTSGDVTGDHSNGVGYASIVFE